MTITHAREAAGPSLAAPQARPQTAPRIQRRAVGGAGEVLLAGALTAGATTLTVGSSAGRVRRAPTAGVKPASATRANGSRIVRMPLAESRTDVVQRKLVADGAPGAGKMEPEEQASLDGLLRHNDFDPLAFTAAGYAALKVLHDRIGPLEEKISRASGGKKIQAKAAVKVAYDALIAKVGEVHLCAGESEFDAGVTLAVQRYDGLGPGEKKPIDSVFKDVAGQLWPNVNGRGAMPDSFWKEVKRVAKTAHGAAVAAAGFSAKCNEVFADMNDQFGRWDGTLTNRGAWWGSSGPGVTAGAVKVPTSVSVELQGKVGAAWQMQNSFSGGVSFHRARGGIDFIYHMLPPP